jgi:hypothetical protein
MIWGSKYILIVLFVILEFDFRPPLARQALYHLRHAPALYIKVFTTYFLRFLLNVYTTQLVLYMNLIIQECYKIVFISNYFYYL